MTQPNVERHVARVVRELERHGLVLETDPKLPSLVALVAGAPVRGSWWGHPLGHTIFAVGEALYEHPDVLLVKLISGKATWVHRRLWPALLAVARAREPWQLDGLSPEARALLGRIEREGEVRAGGAAAREIETRLLARGSQVHAKSGRHAKVLQAWGRWRKRGVDTLDTMTPGHGRGALETALETLNREHGGRGRFPWQPPARRTSRSR